MLRYPFGTLRASQMCRWGQVRLRWWQGGSQWPALIILQPTEERAGRSEVDFLVWARKYWTYSEQQKWEWGDV